MRAIDYTARLRALMADIVGRVPALGFIDTRDVLVFARFGRRSAGGAFATCHCLDTPTTVPDRYSWTDRRTGRIVRQSEWFVTRSPEVTVDGHRIRYLISFALPRFCDETLARSNKQGLYPGAAPWIAKLDTVVHELYHIGPGDDGIRRATRSDGTRSRQAHGAGFSRDVAAMVQGYLATRPDPLLLEFLTLDFDGLRARHGTIVATTFRTFPAFPQRYLEAVDPQPSPPEGRLVRIRRSRQLQRYSEADLRLRRFKSRGAPVPWVGKGRRGRPGADASGRDQRPVPARSTTATGQIVLPFG